MAKKDLRRPSRDDLVLSAYVMLQNPESTTRQRLEAHAVLLSDGLPTLGDDVRAEHMARALSEVCLAVSKLLS